MVEEDAGGHRDQQGLAPGLAERDAHVGLAGALGFDRPAGAGGELLRGEIEAVVEDLAIKKALFSALDEVASVLLTWFGAASLDLREATIAPESTFHPAAAPAEWLPRVQWASVDLRCRTKMPAFDVQGL